jgi:hypothetical protein
MQCYECAKAGSDKAAVATCPRCTAGLCLEHLREAAAGFGPGGTTITCHHDTWMPTRAAAPAPARR